MKVFVRWTLMLALLCVAAMQENSLSEEVPSAQISLGAEIDARHCSPCHGPRMLDPEGAFDLRRFPPDQKGRFVLAVTKGKNTMPPWGDLLKPEDIDALWVYVLAGGKS